MEYNEGCSDFNSEDLKSPSSNVENDGCNDKPQFSESLKLIESFAGLVACVICGKLPQEKVYTLGRCFHKYCEKCVNDYAGNPCFVCGENGYLTDVKEDLFSTSVLMEIPKVYKVLTGLQDMSSAGTTGEKRKALSNPTPELQDSDEDIEEDNQNVSEDNEQFVVNEAKIEFDPDFSEKARDNLHLNAISFSTLDGNGAKNDLDHNKEPVAQKKNELQKEVSPVPEYDANEFIDCTLLSGANKNKKAFPDVLEKTPQNIHTSHQLEGRSSCRKTFCTTIKGIRCLDFPMDVRGKNENERDAVVGDGLEKRKKQSEIPTKANFGKSNINAHLNTPDPDEESILSDEELFKSQISCQGDVNEAGPDIQIDNFSVLTPHVPSAGNKTSTQSEQSKQLTKTLEKKQTPKSDFNSEEQEPSVLTLNVTTEKETKWEEVNKKTGNKMKTHSKHDTSRRNLTPIASCSDIPDWLSYTKSARRKEKIDDFDDDVSANFEPFTKILPSAKVRSRRFSSSFMSKVALLSPSSSSSTSLSDSFNSSKHVKEKGNDKGETALHIACRAGQVDRVKTLVEDGYDVDAKDYAGWTPLHEVVTSKKTSNENIVAIISILHEKGCNMNAVGGPEQETVLHLAVQYGIEEIVAMLLDLGASPKIRNRSKELARDLAYNEVIVSMLDNKAGKCNGDMEDAVNASNYGSVTTQNDSALTNVREDSVVLYPKGL